MNEHDPVLAKHLEYIHKMRAKFQWIADVYERNGLPPKMISSIFFGAALDSLLAVLDREEVVELLLGAIETIEHLDENSTMADILHCEGSA
jgi:hypothetical protein